MKKLIVELLEWGNSLIFAMIIVIIMNLFITPTMVYSISMNPTLVEKDVLILYKTSSIQRGDIVSFKSELLLTINDIKKLNPIQKLVAKRKPQKNLIKRVIGLPGDSVLIENTKVYINGEKLDEPYIGSITTGSVDIKKIPENEYFLMGDNRSHSTDSRETIVGTVSKDRIIGKSLVRIYPLNKLGNVE